MNKEIKTVKKKIEREHKKELMVTIESELKRILEEEPEKLLQKHLPNYAVRELEKPIWEITNIFNDDEKEYIRELISELDIFNYYYENYREYTYQCLEYQEWLLENPPSNENEDEWYELENDIWFEDLDFQYFIIDEILIDEFGEDKLDEALMKVEINPKKYCGEISDELLAIRKLNWQYSCSRISGEEYDKKLEVLESDLRKAEKRKDTIRKERRTKKVIQIIRGLEYLK